MTIIKHYSCNVAAFAYARFLAKAYGKAVEIHISDGICKFKF